MARGVIAYSGLITKTRAMKKNLLNQEQLGQIGRASCRERV